MGNGEIQASTLGRLGQVVELFLNADGQTQVVILAELIGNAAYIVEATQQVTTDAALNIALATLEAKLGGDEGCS